MVNILMVFGSMEVLPYVLLGPAEEQELRLFMKMK